MTEPVAPAVSPRRSVRVAVALVAGQAALCAVIGWLTFGPSTPAAQPPEAVGPVAAPPPGLPTGPAVPTAPTAGLPPLPTRKPADWPTATLVAPPATSDRTPQAAVPDTAEGAAEAPRARVKTSPAAPRQQPVASPADPAALEVPVASDEVQEPVLEGEPCDPEGASGATEDGVSLRCVRVKGNRLVWQIN